jgi:AcrR family transcriptional regulator
MTLTFKLNERLYLRDPQHTELGRKIILKSIDLIDSLGIEQFTFRKLADEIDSTEASIYRYFENKHRLLHYLTAWYWSWLEFRIDLFTGTIQDPKTKLKECLRIVSEEKKYDPTFEFINEEALHRIVIAEMDKTYLTKWVEDDNKAELFIGFKSLCQKIANMILQVKPGYPFARSLASTLLLTTNQQLFFSAHLPSLTDITKSPQRHPSLDVFLEQMVFGALAVTE